MQERRGPTTELQGTSNFGGQKRMRSQQNGREGKLVKSEEKSKGGGCHKGQGKRAFQKELCK